jgi:hypothetical protein
MEWPPPIPIPPPILAMAGEAKARAATSAPAMSLLPIEKSSVVCTAVTEPAAERTTNQEAKIILKPQCSCPDVVKMRQCGVVKTTHPCLFGNPSFAIVSCSIAHDFHESMSSRF